MSQTHNLSLVELQAQLEAARVEQARLKAMLDAQTKAGALTMKISEKGALSVYGLGRFPVTLYKSQWIKLLAQTPALQEFIQANGPMLKDKAE